MRQPLVIPEKPKIALMSPSELGSGTMTEAPAKKKSGLAKIFGFGKKK